MTLGDVADEIAAAVRVLSRYHIGVIILLDPAVPIGGGLVLDAVVSRELLVSLAVPEYINGLHRGAVIIRGDRVERAGVPISWETVVERAAELAAGVAIAADARNGRIRIADRTGLVALVDSGDLVGTINARRG